MWNKIEELKKRIIALDVERWKLLIKMRPKATLAMLSVVIGFGFWLFSPRESTSITGSESKIEKPKMTGLKDAVDPRAVWVDELTKSINNLNQKFDESQKLLQQSYQKDFSAIHDDIKALKEKATNTVEQKNKKLDSTTAKMHILKPPSNFVHLQQVLALPVKKDPENYVVSGSFARAVLLTGVVAETGTESASNQQPILLRLVDHGIFSKGYKTEQIKEAILIGSCYGNISSERALCRLQSLSLMNNENEIVEKPVEGWVIGEDGRPGLKGDVIDKASDVSRMAMLNGILGGMASFFQNQATAGVYPISPITGQQHALTGANSLKASSASGVGNALQKLADYAIKRAEQMSPVIIIGAGRTVDVVFKNGFGLKNVGVDKEISPVTSVSNNQHVPQNSVTPATNVSNGQTRNDGYNDGMKSLESFSMGKGNF
jgi:conjugal transfer pilus assembly protein TraB